MVREGYGSGGRETSMKPAWLEGLMGETFFGGCGVHLNLRKNEKNVFCLLCCLSLCPHCLPPHDSHPLLQPYTINGAKVIFLKQRTQSRSVKGPANICFTCDRILQEPFHFCSLSCKVDYLVNQRKDLSIIIYRFDESYFTISQFEGLRVDGSEVTDDDGPILDDPSQSRPPSGSIEATGDSAVSQDPSAATTTKKKKKGSGFFPGILLSSRRKGAPQRAPLS